MLLKLPLYQNFIIVSNSHFESDRNLTFLFLYKDHILKPLLSINALLKLYLTLHRVRLPILDQFSIFFYNLQKLKKNGL